MEKLDKRKQAVIRLPQELWDFVRNFAHISNKSINSVMTSAIFDFKKNFDKSVDM